MVDKVYNQILQTLSNVVKRCQSLTECGQVWTRSALLAHSCTHAERLFRSCCIPFESLQGYLVSENAFKRGMVQMKITNIVKMKDEKVTENIMLGK